VPLTADAVFPCDYLLDAEGRGVVAAAIKVLEESAVFRNDFLDNTAAIKNYCVLRFAGLVREEFVAIWADSLGRIISVETLATGSLHQAVFHVREVVRAGLANNAAAVIFAHNHPGSDTEETCKDAVATFLLKSALMLVDIVVVDHLIVAGGEALSFVEAGLMESRFASREQRDLQ